MGIMVDLLIIAIVGLSVFLGYKKGIISLTIQLFAFIIAIVITLILYRPISNFVINTTGIDEAIQNEVLKRANDIMESEEKNEVKDVVINEAKENILPQTARTIAINVVTFGVLIILFIVIRIILRFISAFANLISKLPVLNQFNKLGGLLYGLIRGILLIYVFMLIINFSGIIYPKNAVYSGVQESSIGKAMSDYNILNLLLDKVNLNIN